MCGREDPEKTDRLYCSENRKFIWEEKKERKRQRVLAEVSLVVKRENHMGPRPEGG